MIENNIRYSFTTYARVKKNSGVETVNQSNSEIPENDSDSSNVEVKSFSYLPKMIFEKHEEFMYLRLVEGIISNGVLKDDRTGTGTLSKFGCQVMTIIDKIQSSFSTKIKFSSVCLFLSFFILGVFDEMFTSSMFNWEKERTGSKIGWRRVHICS